MREQKTVQVQDEQITVFEMTPREVVLILPLFRELFSREKLTEAELIDLLVKNYDSVKEVLVNCTSAKQEILNFGISSLIPIIKAFVEVNRGFFTQARRELLGEP